MNDTIRQNIESLALGLVNNIYLIDIINDVIDVYSYDNELIKKESLNLTDYLEEKKSNIKEEYLTTYMNSFSVPKLKEELEGNTNYIKYVYSTLDNKNYTNVCKVIEVDEKECILMIELISDNKTVDNGSVYNNLINMLSDSIIKIQNLFNLDSNTVFNPSAIEDYITSIFSNLYKAYPELRNSVNKTAANVSGRTSDAILIVDDDKVMRQMIKKVFKDSTFKIVELQNGKEALEYLKTNETKGVTEDSDHIVGMFLDLTMPVLDGFGVLEYLSKKNYLTRMPVIIISGDFEKETKTRVYNYGIADMLEKPFDFEVVRHRITNFINLYRSSNSLNDLISSQNSDLKELINPIVEAYKYDYEENINNVSNYVKKLATTVMDDYPEYNLDEEKINKMAEASMYYDIGFYSIPRSVLIKKENLTNDELGLIKNYPSFGSKMIDYVLSLTTDELYITYAKNIANFYHENYDGTGYPNNLKGEDIPVEAQIAAIAIAYNNYVKKGLNPVENIVNKSGKIYNPKLVLSLQKNNL